MAYGNERGVFAHIRHILISLPALRGLVKIEAFLNYAPTEVNYRQALIRFCVGWVCGRLTGGLARVWESQVPERDLERASPYRL